MTLYQLPTVVIGGCCFKLWWHLNHSKSKYSMHMGNEIRDYRFILKKKNN